MEADTDSDTEKPVAFRYVVIKTSLFGEQGYTVTATALGRKSARRKGVSVW